MLKLFQGLSKLLANYTSIFVIGVAVFTFFLDRKSVGRERV